MFRAKGNVGMKRRRIQATGDLVLKRRRKTVRFSESVVTIPSQSKSYEEQKTVWYQRLELAEFKLEARNYILAVGGVEDSRGFEGYNLERYYGKKKAVRFTILAYRYGMTDEAVCLVEKRCSEWFRILAIMQACQDFYEVYHLSLADL